MNLDRVFNIAGSIVILAGVTVVVSSPRTAGIIRSIGEAFSGSLTAATATAR